MKKTIESVVKFLIYASFFVPVLVAPTSFIFPFIVPKILLFRSLVLVMLGCYALLLVINWREYRPKFTALNIVLAAYLLSFALSTFFGVDPYHSFWDNHERMLGLFTVFHYIAYYFVCSAVFKNWTDWKWAFRIFLLAGSVVMFIGLLQTQNPDLLLNQGSSRVASTLGNPIYVGGYGLFLSFIAFLLFVKENNPVWKWGAAVLGILAVLGNFASGTRGAMLGLAAGIAAAIVGYAIVLKNYKKIRWTLVGIMILFVASIGLLVAFRQTEFVRNLPAIGRTVNTSFADLKASPRWIAWQIAWQSFVERPVFGWGPNNYFYAFNQHYNPRSLSFGYGETWFDNAHNIILNTMTVQGVFGILVYLSVFGVGLASLIIGRRRHGLGIHITVVGAAFLAAHLVGNITVFENPTSYLYFMVWLAFINTMAVSGADASALKVAPEQRRPDKQIGIGLAGAAGAVVLFLIFIFNIQPARANNQTLNAIRLLTNNPVLGVDAMRQVLDFSSPHIDDIRSDLGRTVVQILNSGWQSLGKDRSMEMLTLTIDNVSKNLILHPADIRNHLTLSQLAQLGYTISGKPQFVFDSEKYLTDALKFSPRRQQLIYSLIGIKLQLSKSGEAISMLEQTITDNPAVGESYWRLGYVYKTLGDMKKAREIIDLADKNGVIFTDDEKAIIARLFSDPVKK